MDLEDAVFVAEVFEVLQGLGFVVCLLVLILALAEARLQLDARHQLIQFSIDLPLPLTSQPAIIPLLLLLKPLQHPNPIPNKLLNLHNNRPRINLPPRIPISLQLLNPRLRPSNRPLHLPPNPLYLSLTNRPRTDPTFSMTLHIL